MRKIYLKEALPGMTVAREIITDTTILVGKGKKLTESMIARLRTQKVNQLFVEDRSSSATDILDVLADQIKNRAFNLARNILSTIQKDEKTKETQKQLIEGALDNILSNPEVLAKCVAIRGADDYTFLHSVNVTIISMVLGTYLDYSSRKLQLLAMAALLHDLGKIKIPAGVLLKPANLTTEEYLFVRNHPMESARMVNDLQLIDSAVADGIYSHHERWDGSGYPDGLKGEKIPEFARIIAMADVYDAMTNDRYHRKKFLPCQAVDFFMIEGQHLFDPELVKLFVNKIAVYPIGTIVQLSTGQIGVVVNPFRTVPARPVVRVAYDLLGKKLSEERDLDLGLYKEISIEKTFFQM